MSENVKVVVRCRPLSDSEQKNGYQNIVQVNSAENVISLSVPDVGKAMDARRITQDFTFDKVLNDNCHQDQLFGDCVKPIVANVLEGYNATIFTYGQTGAGKTYTMLGEEAELSGIMPRVFSFIFERIRQSGDKEYLVRASYLELYNEEIHDLLNKDNTTKLELRETRNGDVYVKGLRNVVVESQKDLTKVLKAGCKNRAVGQTLMNKESSRSHSIFTITVECREIRQGDEGESIRCGKIYLVDLAGSERQVKTGSTGIRFKEAANINLSLSCLSNVINALSDDKQSEQMLFRTNPGSSGCLEGRHVPFRDSKLTRLLQDSLGGNSKTLMLATIGPADYNYEETLGTLRYANRAKNITNKPKINEDPKDAMIRSFQEEIAQLKQRLADLDRGTEQIRSQALQAKNEAPSTPTDTQLLARKRSDVLMNADQMEQEIEVDLSTQQRRLNQEDVSQASSISIEMLQTKKKQHEAEADSIAIEKADLLCKIQNMQKKLLKGEKQGGMSALASMKEQKLERRQAKLTKKLEKELRRESQISALKGENLDIDKKSKTLEQIVEERTHRLESAMRNFQSLSEEAEDCYHQASVERREFINTYHSLERELQLKNAIIAAFIPEAHQKKVMGAESSSH